MRRWNIDAKLLEDTSALANSPKTSSTSRHPGEELASPIWCMDLTSPTNSPSRHTVRGTTPLVAPPLAAKGKEANNQQKNSQTPAKSSSSSTATATAPHPLTLRRRLASPFKRSPHMTRSHATSTTTTTSSVATGSQAQQQQQPQPPAVATHDHNYLGNMNPSSSRAPRRILSRHQRNADELDTSPDPLESSRLHTAIVNHRPPIIDVEVFREEETLAEVCPSFDAISSTPRHTNKPPQQGTEEETSSPARIVQADRMIEPAL